MFNESHIQVGAGRYIQHHGAIKELGSEAAYFGRRAFLLISDELVSGKVMEKLSASLNTVGIEYKTMIYSGPSTQKSFDYITGQVKEYDTDVIIGVGGGRILDIAKAAGDIVNAKIITVPTSAATCAAYAILYVVYGEDGSVEKSGFLKHEISAVIVDTDIVVYDCPVRYLASGIADAMAKKPEFLFTMLNLGDEGRTVTSDIATSIAGYTYAKYIAKGLQAIREFKGKKDTVLLDDIVCMNIMLTGMVSNLSTGGKQLAIAHNLYDAICCLHKEIRAEYLHGEIVGMALPLQIAVNGGTLEEINECKSFMAKIGCPTSLAAVGFPNDKKKMEELILYIHKKTIANDMVLFNKIKDGIRYIV